jgi:hypothetical protein
MIRNKKVEFSVDPHLFDEKTIILFHLIYHFAEHNVLLTLMVLAVSRICCFERTTVSTSLPRSSMALSFASVLDHLDSRSSQWLDNKSRVSRLPSNPETKFRHSELISPSCASILFLFAWSAW